MCDYSLQHVAHRPAAVGDRLVSTRFYNSTTHGFMAGHVAPEAPDGGPIAVVHDGDTIVFDVERRELNVELAEYEIAERIVAFRNEHGALRYMLPWMHFDVDEMHEVFKGDPWPYGIERNRPTLEALVHYMVEQHLIAAPIPLERLFVPLPAASGS